MWLRCGWVARWNSEYTSFIIMVTSNYKLYTMCIRVDKTHALDHARHCDWAMDAVISEPINHARQYLAGSWML